jgi:hypothetical protein
MVRRSKGQELALLGASRLEPVLPRQLQSRLHRLRAASEWKDQLQVSRGQPGDLGGQLFDRIMGKRRPAHVPQGGRLAGQSVRNFAHPMTNIGDIRSPASVQVATAPVVIEVAPLPTHDAGVAARQLAIEDVRFGVAVGAHRWIAECAGRLNDAPGGNGGGQPETESLERSGRPTRR